MEAEDDDGGGRGEDEQQIVLPPDFTPSEGCIDDYEVLKPIGPFLAAAATPRAAVVGTRCLHKACHMLDL